MFVIANPYRAIVDVPNLDFQLPASAGRAGRGLVKAYRYGQFEAGRSRIVIDATGPVRIENGAFAPPTKRSPGRLTFDLVSVSPAEVGQVAGGQLPPAEPVGLRPGRFEDSGAGQQSPPARGRRLPVVVIDPGHGGIDPGTVSATNLTEKTVVLAVALHLRAILTRARKYQIRMTRDKDVFVALKKRVQLSREAGADLFISIHADALAEKEVAASVHGATIYTLSEKASDAAALKLAEKENAADLLAGLASVPASDEDQVRSILIDLVRRETDNFSTVMRRLLVTKMKGRVPLSKEPQRSAAFTVLKQAETPSVLIELGYMSNPEDLARLSRSEWQRRAATAIADAVDAYFQRSKAHVGRQ